MAKSLLLIANDYVGRAMAGPGLRYFHFARELSRDFDVTLLVPNEPDLELEGVPMLDSRPLAHGDLVRLVGRFDVVVTQQVGVRLMQHLASEPVQVVYDVYDPFMIENLPLYAGDGVPTARDRAEYRLRSRIQQIAVATGNAFICASERQRDLWLGVLAALGRLDPALARRDPALERLIAVVPSGIDPHRPPSARGVVKGAVEGIAATDKLLLWGGGIWNWLDPLTVIRAVARIGERRDDVKLLFLGVTHPNPRLGRAAMADRAVALAHELGVYGRSVFFNVGWVPYREREHFLAEADLGVSAHFDTVETRFAFRTRILDYFWASLPSVCTRGDVLGDLVGARALGRVVDFEDVDGWVGAIESLLDDEDAYRAARARLERVRAELAWSRVVGELGRLAALPGAPVARSAETWAMTASHYGLRARMSLASRGVGGSARTLLGKLAG